MLSPAFGARADIDSYDTNGYHILHPPAGGQLTDSARARTRGGGIFLSFLLAATVILLYSPLVRFPFVQDDWALLHRFMFRGPAAVIADAFSPAGKIFYRPLGIAYCLVVYGLFGLNATGFHVLSIIILGASAFLVVAIARALTGEETVAWTSGFLFATAAGIHFDPEMWLVGVFDTGATLLSLLCVLGFLRKRYILSAVAMAAATGFKESAALLLPVVLALAVVERKVRGPGGRGGAEILRDVRWHAAAGALYVAVKLREISLFSLPETHPYAAKLLGPHVTANLGLYGTWALQAVTPLKGVSFSRTGGEIAVIAAAVIVTAAAFGALRRRREEEPPVESHAPAAAFALAWFLCMLAPPLTLRSHALRYYLSGALPPLAIGTALGLRAAARALSRSAAAPVVLCALFAAACAADGARMVWEKAALGSADGVHASGRDGDDHLVRKATVVAQTMKPLLEMLPALPSHTLLVMEGVETSSFAGSDGLQVWYRDSTLLLTEFVPPRPDSAGMMHVTLHREVTGEGQEPSAITLPASRVVHVLRSGEAISIVPP